MEKLPFLLFGRDFWERVVNWEALAESGTIARADLDLFRFVETAEEALETIRTWGTKRERRQTIPGRESEVPVPGQPDQPGDGS
jgi:predicted Rossmann-fold nucleotide-binding protein